MPEPTPIQAMVASRKIKVKINNQISSVYQLPDDEGVRLVVLSELLKDKFAAEFEDGELVAKARHLVVAQVIDMNFFFKIRWIPESLNMTPEALSTAPEHIQEFGIYGVNLQYEIVQRLFGTESNLGVDATMALAQRLFPKIQGVPLTNNDSPDSDDIIAGLNAAGIDAERLVAKVLLKGLGKAEDDFGAISFLVFPEKHYEDGKLHREFGSAVFYASRPMYSEYWLHGELLSETEYVAWHQAKEMRKLIDDTVPEGRVGHRRAETAPGYL